MDEEVKKYIKEGDKVIFEQVLVSHDGYDNLGPQSNLYDLVVIIEREGNLFFEVFHKEDWFTGDVEEYYPLSSQLPFSRNLSKLLEDKGYSNFYDFQIKSGPSFFAGNNSLSGYKNITIFPRINLYFKV